MGELVEERAGGWLRVAIVDIGSASIRSVAVEVDAAGGRRVLCEERSMTKLASALATTGRITAEACARSVEVIAGFVARARAMSCTVIRAFATSAVREAGNGGDFVRAVREATGREGAGVDVEIVSEEEEGLLALRSAAGVVDVRAARVAVADLGGGSLEIVVADEGKVELNRSLRLGAVRLTEQFGGGEACAGARYDEMERQVRAGLRGALAGAGRVDVLVGSGGTLTTLAAMGAGVRERAEDQWSVRADEVGALLERVRGLPVERRSEVAGLQPDRAEIIVAGLLVVRELMAMFRVESLMVNPGGLREGLLLKVIEEARAR